MCCSSKVNLVKLMECNKEDAYNKQIHYSVVNDINQMKNRSFLSIAMQMTFHQSFESVILFESWRTSGPLEYFISCLFIILLGCFTMYLSSLHKTYIRKISKIRREKTGNLNLKLRLINFCMVAIYYFMHYLLMLIAMTFNWGLFISVIIGLSIGYVIFDSGPSTKNDSCYDKECDYPSCC